MMIPGIHPAPMKDRPECDRLGIGIVRGSFPWNPTVTGAQAAQEMRDFCDLWAGYGIVATIRVEECPTNLGPFTSALKAAIKAAAGAVKWWECGNEVFSPNFWHDTRASYLRLLRSFVKAVRMADVHAVPVIAGLASEILLHNKDLAADELRTAASMGIAADLHLYGPVRRVAETLTWARGVYGAGPLLVTETGGPDIRYETYSDEGNASQVHLRAAACRAAGVEAMCWLGLHRVMDTPWAAKMSLLRADGTRKPSWFAMQQEAAKR